MHKIAFEHDKELYYKILRTIEPPNYTTYSRMKPFFDARILHVKKPAIFCIFNEGKNDTDDDFYPCDAKELMHIYNEYQVEKSNEDDDDKCEYISFIKKYLKDAKHNYYQYIDFLPPPSKPGNKNVKFFNIFSGLRYDNYILNSELPEKLAKLVENVDTLDEIWAELDKNQYHYRKEIKFIKKTF